ncbi:putative U3 small nucleolar RNA-associated protein 11-like [Trifolium pratense]|uniref:Putative U3 small nucleolar RNA-associated protein 11-like n=1 Tax=Trifolium pratense TaxID=57577 RepID=A0A2K3NWM8_TRIPR|nr:putative U3 small nucleolar RNA-associated protein 11-like [Trifolium pratense]
MLDVEEVIRIDLIDDFIKKPAKGLLLVTARGGNEGWGEGLGQWFMRSLRLKVDQVSYWKTERSYKELEARKNRVNQLEKVYMDMAMTKELQKNGRKRKLREDEIVNPTNRPVYKWERDPDNQEFGHDGQELFHWELNSGSPKQFVIKKVH